MPARLHSGHHTFPVGVDRAVWFRISTSAIETWQFEQNCSASRVFVSIVVLVCSVKLLAPDNALRPANRNPGYLSVPRRCWASVALCSRPLANRTRNGGSMRSALITLAAVATRVGCAENDAVVDEPDVIATAVVWS